jgi:hypothetical protein
MTTRDYYVTMLRTRIVRGLGPSGDRWQTTLSASVERPLDEAGRVRTLAVFTAAAPTKDAAVGAVAEWLLRGKPRDMTVRELFVADEVKLGLEFTS